MLPDHFISDYSFAFYGNTETPKIQICSELAWLYTVVTNGVLGSDDVNSFIALAVTFTEQANSMWQQHKFFALYILIV